MNLIFLNITAVLLLLVSFVYSNNEMDSRKPKSVTYALGGRTLFQPTSYFLEITKNGSGYPSPKKLFCKGCNMCFTKCKNEVCDKCKMMTDPDCLPGCHACISGCEGEVCNKCKMTTDSSCLPGCDTRIDGCDSEICEICKMTTDLSCLPGCDTRIDGCDREICEICKVTTDTSCLPGSCQTVPGGINSLAQRCSSIGALYCVVDQKCYTHPYYGSIFYADSLCKSAIKNETGSSRHPLSTEYTDPVISECMNNVFGVDLIKLDDTFWVYDSGCLSMKFVVANNKLVSRTTPVSTNCGDQNFFTCRISLS